jgi:hypothetical protein
VRDVGFKYFEIFELKTSKHARCGLEGESKVQGSDVRHVVLKEAPDDLESRWFATLSNHFNHVNRGCGILFTPRQAKVASSVFNRRYPCYALLIDDKLQSQAACLTYECVFDRVGMFGIWASLSQAHWVRFVRVRSGRHDG